MDQGKYIPITSLPSWLAQPYMRFRNAIARCTGEQEQFTPELGPPDPYAGQRVFTKYMKPFEFPTQETAPNKETDE